MKRNALGVVAVLACCISALAERPQYQIYDLGVVETTDTASEAIGISRAGIAVGRSLHSSGTQAFAWTQSGGMVGLENRHGYDYCVANSANDNGMSVGTCSMTASGTDRFPLFWQGGVLNLLPMYPGQVKPEANYVNASGIVVGSVNIGQNGNVQRGVTYTYQPFAISYILQRTPDNSYFANALGINDSGRVVGLGKDPHNPLRNVGIVCNLESTDAFEVGVLPGMNGAIAYAVANGGQVVGTSMFNQDAGIPFIWSDARGIMAIPLPKGSSHGSARAVNSAGWSVGTASSTFTIPFLYDGNETYRLADLIPTDSGWDLLTNTSSSALGISEGGVIVGTSVHHGQTHAYALVPEQTQCTFCHKRTTTLIFPCNSSEYVRHLDHGDTPGACILPSLNARDR